VGRCPWLPSGWHAIEGGTMDAIGLSENTEKC
jgi:hypothetical protein